MNEPMAFDRVADDYDRMRGGLERGRQSAASLQRDLVPGPVLEVGVGTGVVAVGLQELGWEVSGVDVSAPMLVRARERLGDRVLEADARDLPFPDASFANTVFVHVLHLVGDLDAAVREAARVLRPGGRLVAVHGMPGAGPDELTAALDRLAVLQPPRPDTPAGLAATGGGAGLKLLRQEYEPEYERATSPRELHDSLARRLPPYLWDVDAQTWRTVVEPVLAELLALPDPDRPRPQVWRMRRTVLAKP
ncbi:class I SAM-dependent methyltransferase [Kitasatospora sp. NPDC056138]|uniref:class I SAM-dependent methyltransferase n=1 Tax=Kitasatospora sp. NPDC056138 TaxID=3345724 RepID=UPI0035D6E799